MTAKSKKKYRLFPKSRKSKSGKATANHQHGSFSFSYGTSEVTGKSKSGKTKASYQHYGSFSFSYGTSDVRDVDDFQVPTYPVIEDLTTTPTIVADDGSKTIVESTASTPWATAVDEGIVSSTTTTVVATSTPTISTELRDDTIPTILTIDDFLPPTYGNLTAVDSTSLEGDDTLQVNETTAELSSTEIEKGWNTTAGAVGISITAVFLFSVAVATYLKFFKRRRVQLLP